MNMRKRLSGVGLGLVLASVTSAATSWGATPTAAPSAAPATPPAAPAPAAAPDLVRLKNGGMLRGTIAESGGDAVTIVLVTGETRKIPAAEVVFAGPAASAPSAAPAPALSARAPAPSPPPAAPNDANGVQPFAVVHAAEARVDFASEPAGYTLFRRSASANFAHSNGPAATGYDEICTAPCNASMPSGTHTFAVAKPEGDPTEAAAVALPVGNSTLRAKYVDRKQTRTTLIVVGLLGMTAGTLIELAPLFNSNHDTSALTTGLIVGGSLTGLSLIPIAVSQFVKDGVKLSISPGAGSAPMPSAPQSSSVARSATRFLEQPHASAATLRDGFSGLRLSATF